MGINVLVVDDSAMSRKLTIRALPEGWDATIHQASGGEEALQAYREGKADLMMLDLTMPGMSGFDVLEVLRADGLNCFVVVVSADVQPGARERALDLGAMAFVQKPVQADELQGVLSQYGFLS